MIKKLLYRIVESLNILRNRGVRHLLKRYIYINKLWVVVEKDLTDFEMKSYPQCNGLYFTEIFEENITRQMMADQDVNEFYRIQLYLAKGYHGYMLKRDDDLIGYIWFSEISADSGKNHPDVKYIDITHKMHSAYMFSMYLKPDKRGNNMGAYIYSSLLQLLKNKGFARAYAVYDTKNIPALWVNRMLKFKEVGRLRISQFIFYKFVTRQSNIAESSR